MFWSSVSHGEFLTLVHSVVVKNSSIDANRICNVKLSW